MNDLINEILIDDSFTKQKKKLNITNEEVIFYNPYVSEFEEFKYYIDNAEKLSIYYDENIDLLSIAVFPNEENQITEILSKIDLSSIKSFSLKFILTMDETISLPRDILNCLNNADNLVSLTIDGLHSGVNTLTGSEIIEYVSNLKFAKNLIHLNVQNCRLLEIPKSIEKFTNLKFLNLNFNSISDISNIDYKAKLKELTHIELRANLIKNLNIDLFSSKLISISVLDNEPESINFTENKPNLECIEFKGFGKKYSVTSNIETFCSIYEKYVHNTNNLHRYPTISVPLGITDEVSEFMIHKNLVYNFFSDIYNGTINVPLTIRNKLIKIFKKKIGLGIDVESSKQNIKKLTV